METANRKVNHIHKQNPVLGNHPYINPIGYLTFTMLAKDYNPLEKAPIDEETFLRGISKLQATKHFQELYGYYDAILSGLRYFPVPKVNDSNSDISYVDTWYALRKYGGNRRHEGTDLMSDNNIRGYYPVVSITDGVVENLGWLDKGGYRVGIRSNTGGYFYYAHLYSYAPNLQEGDSVIAGQLIGFMGDSGYGSEGTVGKFDVHLHLGIYVDTDTGELSVNPYWILKMLEKNRTYYHMEEMN
ncbi:MAG: M23 family metallopeptidase [Clostridiales bacterium]|nr:M23 family metallopeptidase [Clostridiales bacterium]